MSGGKGWIRGEAAWLAAWCGLLLPLAILVPPIPIDETRYLTAAWEMFNSTQWLVPTVNGAWYSDKSPLLFWLIAGGWKLFGVHTWVARIEALAIALAMLLALRRLAVRLGVGERAAATAMWLLAGSLGFMVFTTAIMFDLLLSLCTLGALHALLDLDMGKWRRGTLAFGIALGLGILAKGPVMILCVAAAALLAPVWSSVARVRKARWYLALLVAFLIGIAIALSWLLPAAWHAGPTYWHPLLDKVAGRISNSFAHRRPFWWYLPLLPVLLLPWTLVLRTPASAWTCLWSGRVWRFLWCWWAVPFVSLCLISGKQVHYLLPLLPAWALTLAWLLQQSGAHLRTRLFGLLALLVGVAIVALPWLAAKTFGYLAQPAIAVFAVVALVVAVGTWRAWNHDARGIALSTTALVSAALLAGVLAYGPAIHVEAEALFVKRTLQARTPVASIGWHDGLYGYAGRLQQPVPWIPATEVAAWCRAHPGGILLTADSHLGPRGARAFRTWPYIGAGNHRISAWRASDILAEKR